ncbi:MAG TPA: Type 1 glutamine amidotransferase-like domain-containing protein [Ktedonobacteraceae bacterium]
MTCDNQQPSTYGTVALLGSGEYLPVMNEVDIYLLETVGGAQSARMALLPTASGLEPMGATLWNDLGLEHFKQLGVSDIRATRIIDAASANDAAQVALLENANFFYFSGGNPYHIIDTMRDSLAWEHIQAAYKRGAVLAGCSAGAMMLGGQTASLRQVMMGNEVEFKAALGIAPRLIVAPHFDRLASYMDQEPFQYWLRSIPPEYTAVGIDEDTALIRVELNVEGSGKDRWRAMGRQTVQVFVSETQKRVLQSGEEIVL